jgi:hypothetical protein
MIDQLGGIEGSNSIMSSGSNVNRLHVDNHSLGRNTFYVSDYQLHKNSRDFNNQSMSRRPKKIYNNESLVNNEVMNISTAQGNYNLNNH